MLLPKAKSILLELSFMLEESNDLLFDWFGISCTPTDNFLFYLQNRLILTGQTGGQWYSDTSHFSIPWVKQRLTQ